jgi:hypothetical protein
MLGTSHSHYVLSDTPLCRLPPVLTDGRAISARCNSFTPHLQLQHQLGAIYRTLHLDFHKSGAATVHPPRPRVTLLYSLSISHVEIHHQPNAIRPTPHLNLCVLRGYNRESSPLRMTFSPLPHATQSSWPPRHPYSMQAF